MTCKAPLKDNLTVEERNAVLQHENQELRRMLAFASTVYPSQLYTDDGELQDATKHPCIDYKRMTLAEIQAAKAERAKNAIAAVNTESEHYQLGLSQATNSRQASYQQAVDIAVTNMQEYMLGSLTALGVQMISGITSRRS